MGYLLTHKAPSASVATISSPSPASLESPAHTSRAVITIIGSNQRGSLFSQGSGFILTPDGLAGSNFHVLKGAIRGVAECCGGRRFDVGPVVGADLAKDLIVFQLYEEGTSLKPRGLSFVTVRPSRDLSVGEKVMAIGSPEGLENTVSDGILSAIRSTESVRYLQITAPISQGSSGGPVLDMQGQMIGVVTFQLTKGQNLNFAVAADHLLPLLDQHLDISLRDFQVAIRAREKKTDFDAVFQAGLKLYDASEYARAAEKFTKAIDLRPSESSGWYDAGLCYEQMGELDLAAFYYQGFLLVAQADDPERSSVESWLKNYRK